MHLTPYDNFKFFGAIYDISNEKIESGIILTAFVSIFQSLSFWIVRGDVISDTLSTVIINFNCMNLLYITLFTIGIVILAFVVFYKGLKRYSSSNLMSSRV